MADGPLTAAELKDKFIKRAKKEHGPLAPGRGDKSAAYKWIRERADELREDTSQDEDEEVRSSCIASNVYRYLIPRVYLAVQMEEAVMKPKTSKTAALDAAGLLAVSNAANFLVQSVPSCEQQMVDIVKQKFQEFTGEVSSLSPVCQ